MRGRSRAVIALVALFAFGAMGGSATAADHTYVGTATFGSAGSGDGQLMHPRRLAVESSTGNVLVVDRDNDRVQVFAPSGSTATYLAQFGAGELDEPFGVAIDQASGDVYVSDAGNDRIVRYESDAAPTPTYTLDAGFDSPDLGAAAGQVGDFEADVGFDPVAGELLVADPGNNRVSRYSVAGAHVSSFDGADSPDGAFAGLLDLDVAPDGTIYLVDSEGPVVMEGEPEGGTGPCVQNFFCALEPSRVLSFSAAGAFQATVQPLEGTTAAMVAFDPSSNQVLVGGANPRIRVFSPTGRLIVNAVSVPFSPFNGLAATASGVVYSALESRFMPKHEETIGQMGVRRFAPVALPELTLNPAGAVTAGSAELSGSVDPNGTQASYSIQYRRQGDQIWRLAKSGSLEGTAPVPLSVEITELEPNTTYETRLVATGAAQVISDVVEFTTGKLAPFAEARYAAPRTTTTARINGYLNPQNDPTTYYFEWGPTDSYGNSAPVDEAGQAPESGRAVLVSEQLTGLQPNTTYHYRLIAENSVDRVVSDDRTFTTRTAAEMTPAQRGIELVNTPDKSNQSAYGYLANDGHSVIWNVFTGGPEAPTGIGAAFRATRTPSGWSTENMLPTPDRLYGDGEFPYQPYAANDSQSEVIYQVGKSTNIGEVSSELQIVRVGPNRQQQLLHTVPPFTRMWSPVWEVAGGTEHVYILTEEQLDPSHQPDQLQLYDFGAEPPTLISRMPGGGDAAPCGLVGSMGESDFGGQRRWAAADGSRVFFEADGPACENAQLYAYETQGTADVGDDSTIRISPPAVAGPEGEARLAEASRDGKGAVFYATGRLVAEDQNDTIDLYRWRVGEPVSCLTCVVPEAAVDAGGAQGLGDSSRNVHVAPDLSRVYFISPKVLVPGLGEPAVDNLYVWHGGEIDYVAPSSGFIGEPQYGQLNADGSVLVFHSRRPDVTTDPTGGYLHFYRYDDRDRSVECLTCSPAGEAPAEPDRAADGMLGFGTGKPANSRLFRLTGDGGSFFFATEARLVPRDVNGDIDVYQWHNGTHALITDGVTEYSRAVGKAGRLQLLGIGRDGVNVLFRTAIAQTGYERDKLPNLYVARIGGGFGPPPGAPEPCAEDACQGPLSPPATIAPPGSSAVQGAGASQPPASKPKPRKGKKKKGKKGKRRCQKAGKGKQGKRSGKCRGGKTSKKRNR